MKPSILVYLRQDGTVQVVSDNDHAQVFVLKELPNASAELDDPMIQPVSVETPSGAFCGRQMLASLLEVNPEQVAQEIPAVVDALADLAKSPQLSHAQANQARLMHRTMTTG